MIPLLAGESVIASERRHPAVLVPAAVGAAAAVAAPITLIHLVPARVLGHPTGGPKLIADLVIAAAVAVWFLGRALGWRYRTCTLTTHRVVMASGVLSRVTESIALDRVQEVVVRRPLGARLIGCGTLEISSAGRDGVEVLSLIPHAERFSAAVLQAIEDHRHLGAAGAAALPGARPADWAAGL